MSEQDEKTFIEQKLVDAAGQERPTLKARTRGNPAKRNYSMSFYIPRPTAERMQDHARTNNTSMQQIVAEAVDKWLAEQLLPPFYPEGWFDKAGK
jgi:hypothetical protein